MTKRHPPFARYAARIATAVVVGIAFAPPLYADEGLDTPGVIPAVVLRHKQRARHLVGREGSAAGCGRGVT